MNIGITAQNSRKALMEEFCVAYQEVFAKHNIYATYSTGNRIKNVTNLKIHTFLPGDIGGARQFADMVTGDDMDMVIYFYSPDEQSIGDDPDIKEIVRACDRYNIPFATNIATAELLVLGLANGDLDWRMNLKKGEVLF